MLSIKGFMSLNSLINNDESEVNNIGELSNKANTYSRNKQLFLKKILAKNYQLTTFHTENPDLITDSVTSSYVKLSVSISNHIFEVLNVLYKTAAESTIEELKTSITSASISNIKTGSIKMGELVIVTNSPSLPKWVSWENDLTGSPYKVKIWLSNDDFISNYDETEIVILPPPINSKLDLINDGINAYRKISEEAYLVLLKRIEVAVSNDPPTLIKVYDFKFRNQQNEKTLVDLNWICFLYGNADIEINEVKDVIQKYVYGIASASIVKSTFPDLFNNNEYVILPRWDLVSVQGVGDIPVAYSSSTDPVEAVTFCKDNISELDIPDSWIAVNTRIMAVDYKYVTLNVINGEGNTGAIKDISLLFPDYISISSTHVDFNRLSLVTQEWIKDIISALILAETATTSTTVNDITNNKLSLVIRHGVLYVTFKNNGAAFYVAAKSNIYY